MQSVGLKQEQKLVCIFCCFVLSFFFCLVLFVYVCQRGGVVFAGWGRLCWVGVGERERAKGGRERLRNTERDSVWESKAERGRERKKWRLNDERKREENRDSDTE